MDRRGESMKWGVKYGFGNVWELNFPPQYQHDDGEFDEFVTMGDVLAESIAHWVDSACDSIVLA